MNTRSRCCVCGNPGSLSKTKNVLWDGFLLNDNSTSVDEQSCQTLWPIHEPYLGVVIQGELPIKIHAHFPDVPKSRLLNPLSTLCTHCFKVIYNVLQLEKQMLRMKSQLNVKAGTAAELACDSKLFKSGIPAKKTVQNNGAGGSSVIQRKRRKPVGEVAQVKQLVNDDDSTQSSYQTRARRRGAFAGLSKEIIQAELEDEDCHNETLDIRIKEVENDSEEYVKSNMTKKRSQSRKQIQTRRKTSGAKVSKLQVKKLNSGKQKTIVAESKDESNSLDGPFCSVPDNEKFFCCPKCCTFFRKEEFKGFQSHISAVCSIRKRFPCEQCGHIYTTKNVLSYHIESVHHKPHPQSRAIRAKPRKEYVSEMSKIYELLQSDHLESKEGGQNETSVRSEMSFESDLEKIKEELEFDNWPVDKRTAEEIGKSSGFWKCWVCLYESNKKSYWLSHMKRIHLDAKGILLNCEHCLFTFTHKHHLREHLNEMHADQSGYNCGKCDRKFLHKNDNHLCANISCDICGAVFNTRGSKNKHMLTHPEHKPFACEICPKTFKKREYLSLHMRTHDDARPYQCDLCSKRFRSKSHYNNHRRIHTGEKPYVCDLCGRTFVSPQCLFNHLKSHSDIRNFSCDICDKTFRTAYDVKRHRVIHTDEKPFKCKICHKSFNRRGNCLAHERNHVEKGFNEPFTCHICKEMFDRPNKLNKHIKQAHQGKSNDVYDAANISAKTGRNILNTAQSKIHQLKKLTQKSLWSQYL